jgi:rubrerythrin
MTKDSIDKIRNLLDKYCVDYYEMATGHNGAKFYFDWDKSRNVYRKFVGVDDDDTCYAGFEYFDPETIVDAALATEAVYVEGYDDGVEEGINGEWYYTGARWFLSCKHECEGTERPNYCPVCGRKVVDDEL